ncbi:hypothetical protein KC218_23540, partial [Mycobacterium tuberculosis]|nr:hypothetical protein [Mycobacterium tuberculosis]
MRSRLSDVGRDDAQGAAMTPARTLDSTLAGCAIVIADECSTGDLDVLLSSRGATVRRAVVPSPGAAHELGPAAIHAARGEVDA